MPSHESWGRVGRPRGRFHAPVGARSSDLTGLPVGSSRETDPSRIDRTGAARVRSGKPAPGREARAIEARWRDPEGDGWAI
jgi:hypothetical protein